MTLDRQSKDRSLKYEDISLSELMAIQQKEIARHKKLAQSISVKK